MPNFEEIENMDLGQVKAPPLTPRGSYLVQTIGQPERIVSSQKGTPGYKYKIKFFQARDDVDRAELDACLTEGNIKLTDIEMEDIFYITDRSAFMFTEGFLQNVLGFPPDIPVKQAVAESSGMQYIVTIVHKPTTRQDGTTGLRAEIGSRAKAP